MVVVALLSSKTKLENLVLQICIDVEQLRSWAKSLVGDRIQLDSCFTAQRVLLSEKAAQEGRCITVDFSY